LEFTGERFTTLVDGEVRHEHFHRYFFSLQFCAGKRVLDVACGEGYGAALLGSVAAQVIGLDRSIETIRHASLNYSDARRLFQVGRAQDLPIASASIDVVVSFETLEHLEEHDKFLAEIKRVLRSDGVLVMSTPDLDIYSGERQIQNPHHLKELTRAEFQTLMRDRFTNAAFFVQSSIMGSAVAPDRDECAEVAYEGFRRLYDSSFECTPGLPAPSYVICVASNERLPKVLVGSFDDRPFQLGLYAELQHRAEEILRKDAEISHLRPMIAALQAEEAELRAQLAKQRSNESERGAGAQTQWVQLQLIQANTEAQLQTMRELLARREGELTSITQALAVSQAAARSDRQDAEALRHSFSWKLTAPLRAVGSWFLGRNRSAENRAGVN
jgi:ubiquinone/menaquinone biosynthesis C-methylase UbiE